MGLLVLKRKSILSRLSFGHEGFLLGLALLLGSFFCLFLIGSKSVWLDEADSMRLVHLWQPMWSDLFSHEPNMWLYYTILYGWTRLGDSEAYIRLPSALFAIGSLPIYYLLSKKLLGQKVALIAVFLLVVNRFYIEYAQDARSYSLYFFLSLLSTFIFLELLQKPTNLKYFLYILCTILNIYSHAFAVFLLATHFAILLYVSRPAWKRFCIYAIIIIVCTSPILLNQGHVTKSLAGLPPVNIRTLPYYFLVLSGGQPILCIFYAILCSIATVWTMKMMQTTRKCTSFWKYPFIYMWLFLPFLLTIFYSLLIHPLFSPRYLIIGLAPFLLLVSVGLTKITRPLLFYMCLFSICVLSLLSLIGWYTGDQRFTLGLNNNTDDWRTAVTFICNEGKVNDSITFYSYYVHVPYDYYAQKSSVCLRKHLQKIQLGPDRANPDGSMDAPNMLLLKNLPTYTNRIWLVINFEEVAAQRITIQHMLAANYSLKIVKQFEGIEVLLYTRGNYSDSPSNRERMTDEDSIKSDMTFFAHPVTTTYKR